MKGDSLSGVIAGGGSIGTRHAQNLERLGTKVAISDPDQSTLESVPSKFQNRIYNSLSTAIEIQDPDFVVVATPNSTHVDVATKAARRGCHLLIEKPISNDMKGIDALEEEVATRNLTTLVGCNLRFHPELMKIRELLEEGVIGNVVATRIEGGSYLPNWYPDEDYRNSYSAREDLGGGVILDFIHEINYARWFFGEFERISGITGQYTNLEIETNDVAGIIAEVSTEMICEFHLDYTQRPYSRSCHIIGEEGTIHWNWQDERVKWYSAVNETWHRYNRPDNWELNDMYMDELKHFLKCIKETTETTCPVSCGCRDLAIAIAARRSAEGGCHVNPNTIYS